MTAEADRAEPQLEDQHDRVSAAAFAVLLHELKSLIANANAEAEAAVYSARRALRDGLGRGPTFNALDRDLKERLERMWESQRAVAAAMDVSRIMMRAGSERLEMRQKPCLVRVLVTRAISRCRKLAEERPSSPQIELVDRSKGEPVMGDEQLLTIAFLNVILNGLQFSLADARGTTRPVRVTCESDDGVERVVVQSYGGSIADPEGIFRPLHPTGDPRDHSGRRGIGLGLFISRRILTEHGGTIRLMRSVPVDASGRYENVFEIVLPHAPI
jgi:signal transduction histidine kinase